MKLSDVYDILGKGGHIITAKGIGWVWRVETDEDVLCGKLSANQLRKILNSSNFVEAAKFTATDSVYVAAPQFINPYGGR